MSGDDDPQSLFGKNQQLRLFDLEASGSIILDGEDVTSRDQLHQHGSVFALGGISLAGPPPVSLGLPLRDRSEIIVNGVPDLFRALSWNSVLTRLRGRDRELHDVTAWAIEETRSVAMRLITGPGGAGKTRLAAEAVLAMRRAGWAAGFLPRAAKSALRLRGVGTRGLFLVIDYPEEYPGQVLDDLVSALANEDGSSRPVRVLLLSRRDQHSWDHLHRRLNGRFDVMELRGQTSLSASTARDIAVDAADGLAELMSIPLPNMDGADPWLSPVPDEPERRLPLFAAAAGLHAAIAPDDAFGLSGAQLMNDLARRELERVRGVAIQLGLREPMGEDVDDGLARFLALATSNGFGLDGSAILEMQAFEVVPERSPKGVLKALRSTGWWEVTDASGGRLAPLVPDRLAAAFMSRVLLADPADKSDLPELMWLAAKVAVLEKGQAYGNAISRLGHDLNAVSETSRLSFENQLLKMLNDDPERANHFLDLAQSEQTFFSLNFAVRVLEILRPRIKDPVSMGVLLSNLSAFASQLGDADKALEMGREALAIRRSLKVEESPAMAWDLAASLNNVACFLADLGQPDEAAKLGAEAVEIRRFLLARRPAPFGRSEHFERDLADALNNVATFQSELGQNALALESIEEAIEVCKNARDPDTETVVSTLALVTDTLGKRLAAVGRWDAAFVAAEDACRLRRDLVQMRPDAYKPALASSLKTLAEQHASRGLLERAIEIAAEAITIYRFLATSSQTAVTQRLADTLNSMASFHISNNRPSAALDAAEEAVDLHRSLARRRPAKQTPGLAIALQTLSGALFNLGHYQRALEASLESVSIRRENAGENEEIDPPAHASALSNLAVMAFSCGQFEVALDAAQDATDILRKLVAQDQNLHAAALANALNTLAGCHSEMGHADHALKFAIEAVELHQNLAKTGSPANMGGLAMGLETCAKCYNDVGRFVEAIQCAGEAGQIHEQFTGSFPDAAYPALAKVNSSLARYHLNAGQPQKAIGATEEAVAIFRQRTRSRPELIPDLAFALHVLSEARFCTGDTDAALLASDEALGLYRSLAHTNPDVISLDLARSLNARARIATTQTDHALSKALIEEAIRAVVASGISIDPNRAFMELLLDEYLSSSTKDASEPNPELLATVAGLKALQSSRN